MAPHEKHSFELEVVLHPDLNCPTAVQGKVLWTEDAETGVEQISVTANVVLACVEVIKRIQEVRSNLQLALPIRNFEILQHGEVVLFEAGQINTVPPNVAVLSSIGDVSDLTAGDGQKLTAVNSEE